MGNGKLPGVTCSDTGSAQMDGGTSCLAASPLPGTTGQAALRSYSMTGGGKGDEDLSFEMDGTPFESVATSLVGLTAPQMRVLAALRELKQAIVDAERKWRVDRRAIAGAIAWEALNNWGIFGFKFPGGVRAVGLGKIHVYNSKVPLKTTEGADENTVAKQVEDAGYLPAQTLEDRKRKLADPVEAITYIAAIMRAFIEIAAEYGFTIGRNTVILANLFQGKDLPKWRESLEEKKKTGTTTLKGGNTMDIWIGANLVFLEDAVGVPNLPDY